MELQCLKKRDKEKLRELTQEETLGETPGPKGLMGPKKTNTSTTQNKLVFHNTHVRMATINLKGLKRLGKRELI